MIEEGPTPHRKPPEKAPREGISKRQFIIGAGATAAVAKGLKNLAVSMTGQPHRPDTEHIVERLRQNSKERMHMKIDESARPLLERWTRDGIFRIESEDPTDTKMYIKPPDDDKLSVIPLSRDARSVHISAGEEPGELSIYIRFKMEYPAGTEKAPVVMALREARDAERLIGIAVSTRPLAQEPGDSR